MSWSKGQLTVSVDKDLSYGRKFLGTLSLGHKIGIRLSYVRAVSCPLPPTARYLGRRTREDPASHTPSPTPRK
jgi:hypothetical protein